MRLRLSWQHDRVVWISAIVWTGIILAIVGIAVLVSIYLPPT